MARGRLREPRLQAPDPRCRAGLSSQPQPFGQHLGARPLLKPNDEKGLATYTVHSCVIDGKPHASLQLSMPKVDRPTVSVSEHVLFRTARLGTRVRGTSGSQRLQRSPMNKSAARQPVFLFSSMPMSSSRLPNWGISCKIISRRDAL